MSDIDDLRTRQIEQGELWEELKVEHHWFHIVRGMIHNGFMKEMKPMGWAVYCVIKSHANLNTGAAKPSIARIAELIGVSHDTVQRAMKHLEKIGILNKDNTRKTNEYTLRESVPMTMPGGELFGYGESQYAPMHFQSFIEDLQRFAKTGNIPGNKNITVNVTFNVQNITQGEHGQVTMNVQSVALSNDDQTGQSETAEGITELKKAIAKLRNL